jgi:hypothetical protein
MGVVREALGLGSSLVGSSAGPLVFPVMMGLLGNSLVGVAGDFGSETTGTGEHLDAGPTKVDLSIDDELQARVGLLHFDPRAKTVTAARAQILGPRH